METLVILIMICLSLLIIYLFDKFFEGKGLIWAMILLNLIAFAMSFKIANIYHSNINCSIIPEVGLFGALYLYLIKYDEKNIKKIIMPTILSCVFFSLMMIISLYYIPSITETISINMELAIKNNIKILGIYPIMIAISQYFTSKLVTMLKKIKTNNYLIMLLTYIITSTIYSIVCYLLCYINVLSVKEAIFLGVSTYILGLIITTIESLFIYLYTVKKVKK